MLEELSIKFDSIISYGDNNEEYDDGSGYIKLGNILHSEGEHLNLQNIIDSNVDNNKEIKYNYSINKDNEIENENYYYTFTNDKYKSVKINIDKLNNKIICNVDNKPSIYNFGTFEIFFESETKSANNNSVVKQRIEFFENIINTRGGKKSKTARKRKQTHKKRHTLKVSGGGGKKKRTSHSRRTKNKHLSPKTI